MGISANKLKRTLGVVEVDETLVVGKAIGRGSGYQRNKTWVASAFQRGGRLRVECMDRHLEEPYGNSTIGTPRKSSWTPSSA